MIIKFERRTDQPDAAGRCKVYLAATFEGQRLRLSTKERCLASEWNEEKGCFRKSLNGSQEANGVFDAVERAGDESAPGLTRGGRSRDCCRPQRGVGTEGGGG